MQMDLGADVWMQAARHSVRPGSRMIEAPILFSRVDDDVIDVQLKKLGVKGSDRETEGSKMTAEETSGDTLISIEEFAKVKLKTASITSAERVPKSEKLVRLVVDTGSESRQIVAGIARHYRPEDLVGRIVVIVANLKPVRLMGLKSQGMVLAASNSEGVLVLVTPESAEIGPGAVVK